MRKILCIISIVCNALSLFTLVAMITPKLVNYDDGIGFFGIFLSIICTGLVLPFWLIFASIKSNRNKKLQIIASISFTLHIVLLGNFFLDFLHIGGEIIIAQIVLSIIALSLCIGYSKKSR